MPSKTHLPFKQSWYYVLLLSASVLEPEPAVLEAKTRLEPLYTWDMGAIAIVPIISAFRSWGRTAHLLIQRHYLSPTPPNQTKAKDIDIYWWPPQGRNPSEPFEPPGSTCPDTLTRGSPSASETSAWVYSVKTEAWSAVETLQQLQFKSVSLTGHELPASSSVTAQHHLSGFQSGWARLSSPQNVLKNLSILSIAGSWNLPDWPMRLF